MSNLLTRLTIITLAAFTFCLALNRVLGGNPLNRIGYAVFVSVLPGVITFLLFKIGKLGVTWIKVVTVYIFLFVLTIISQGLLRSV